MVSDRDSGVRRGIYNHIQKPDDVTVRDQLPKLLLQDAVVDPIKIFRDVTLQDPAVRVSMLSEILLHEALQTVKAEVCTTPLLTGVVVVDEGRGKNGFQDIVAQAMLNDLVAEAVIHYQSFLRFVYHEAVVRRKPVSLRRQHDVKEHDVFQVVDFVPDDSVFPSFPLPGLDVGFVQAVKVGHFGVV